MDTLYYTGTKHTAEDSAGTPAALNNPAGSEFVKGG